MWAKAFSQYQEERVEETVNAIMQYWKSRQLDAQKEQVNQPVMSLEGALLSSPFFFTFPNSVFILISLLAQHSGRLLLAVSMAMFMINTRHPDAVTATEMHASEMSLL